MRILFLLWLLTNAGNSVSTNLVVTDINNTALNYLWGNLSQIASQRPAQLITASEECVNGLLDYLSPKILNLSNYAGLFSANCSVFFDRVLEKVECEMAASNTSLVNNNARRIPGIPLPARYMSQLLLSHILMTRIEADWRGDKYQQQINHLWLSQNPCTASKSDTHSLETSPTDIALNTDTQDLPLTETEELTPSWLDTLSNTLLASKSALQSLTASWSSSLSSTQSQSHTHSQTDSPSVSRSLTPSSSQTISETASKTQTRLSGLLAAWNQSSGVYEDATSQIGRYNASSEIVTDTFTGLQWQQVSSNSTMSWADAVQYCVNQTTGGFNDWRLPNNAELESLVDYTIPYKGLIPGINSIFNNTPTNYFYSSTPLVGLPTQQPWWISFGQTACYSGLLYSLQYSPSCTPAVAGTGYTRCVRSAYQPLPPVRYTTTSDTVTDTITGLIWQRVSTGGPMNQTAALAYCSALNLPSFSTGWRLPKVKELATLVDYSVPYGKLMMDATVFAGEPVNAFWSSTPVAGLPTYAWHARFGVGRLDSSLVTTTYSARCVACSVPPTTGLLAAWNQAGGTYADSTNQPGRYSISNGIVTDTFTGIQWQQNASSTAMNWTDAIAYCANQTTGGLSGWRVPNIGELGTLVDYTASSPYVNTAAFPGATNASLWSSTPEVGNGGGNSWDLQLTLPQGTSYWDTTATANKVRCVRSCYALLPSSRYAIVSGVVTDAITGLVWQQRGTGGRISQTDALSHCEQLNLPGYAWRLPTVRELATLVDYSRNWGTLMMDPTVFTGEDSTGYWSSTAVFGAPAKAWYLNVAAGFSEWINVTFNYPVRCVACSVPPTTGLLAAWNQAGGTYADSTNQPGRYSISNGIVTDTFTGIQWQQNASSTAMNWTDAIAYCSDQTTGGLSGWRVPNIAELGTLLDYTVFLSLSVYFIGTLLLI